MSTVVAEQAEPADEASFTSRNILDYVPGVLLLVAVGLLGKYAQVWWNSLAHQQHWRMPDIEYVLWAIVFGLLVTNTVGLHRIFRAGVQTYEFWLKIGIVALGVRFVLGDVVKLGGISLVQILVDMALAGGIILAAAHFSACPASSDRCWLSERPSAVCRPSSPPKAPSGPAIPTSAMPSRRSSRWVLYSEQDRKIAVLVKSTRNALIGFVVLGFALYWASRGEADRVAPGLRARALFVWDKFPTFVLGFLAVSAIATAGWLSKGQTANVANVSRWAFLLTFAGVGLNTNIRELVRTGWRPLAVAVIGLVVVAAVSLGLVLITSRGLHWGIGAG